MTYAVDREHYSIDFDPARHFVKVVRRGFWTVAVFDEYVRELRSILELVQIRQKDFVGLIDIRDQGVQTAEVAQCFQRLIADDSIQPVRVAVLTTKALSKLQAERVGRTTQRVFTTEKEALAWLFPKEPDT